MNDRIRAPRVLLINTDGDRVGEVAIFEALKAAKELDLDLVEIAPNSTPPVCRIMDFGKFKYDLAKAEKKNSQHSKDNELKEIRLSAKIDDHDMAFKAKQARAFMNKGHQVKVSMRLVGRENIFIDRAFGVFNQFAGLANSVYENQPKRFGNRMEAMLITNKIEDETKNPQSDKKTN